MSHHVKQCFNLEYGVIQLVTRSELKLKKQPRISPAAPKQISCPFVIYERENLTEKAVCMSAYLLLQEPAEGEHITISIRRN